MLPQLTCNEPAAVFARTRASNPRSGERGYDSAEAPLVSVCIANWNCRELLRNCLRSLLNQDQGVSLEAIVVDNASTDGAADMVAREFPQAHLIRNSDNVGFARANNQAALFARGRHLFFLNNDTVVFARTLAGLTDYLENHHDTLLVGPRLLDGTGKLQISYRRCPTVGTFLHRTLLLRWTGLFRRQYREYRRQEFDDSAEGRPVDVLMGAALMARRAEFLGIGGWDEDFAFGGEDLDLCYRANQRGYVVYLPTVSITHFGRASTRDNIAYASPRIVTGFAQYFRKSGATPAALLGYKLAVTLDAPLQILVKGIQYLARRLTGKRQRAEQSLTVIRGMVPFLSSGLLRFWRA